MEISVTDFSAPIGASVFKFCVHLQKGKVYCVKGNLYPRYEVYRGYIVFAFSVIMFVCLSVCLFVCKLFFPSKISQQLLGLGF